MPDGAGYHDAVPTASGEQHVLVAGDQEAVVTEVGATLRSYVCAGRDVCWGFAADEISGGGRGQVLAPWPNRLQDGAYEFDGLRAQAALDEPGRSNAIHGLVRWVPWRLLERSDPATVRLGYVLFPQPAYPFQVRLEVRYRLDARGLEVTISATGEGERRAPFGAGFHPYLSVSPGTVDEARISLPARQRLLLDGRGLPIGSEDVAGTPYEAVAGPAGLEARPALGSMRLDDCFADLALDADGRWRARLATGEPGSVTELWADGSFGYLMCFTGDSLPAGDRRRGIAIEPMTCPPDALRSGEGLVVLEPGERFEASWGIVPPVRG